MARASQVYTVYSQLCEPAAHIPPALGGLLLEAGTATTKIPTKYLLKKLQSKLSSVQYLRILSIYIYIILLFAYRIERPITTTFSYLLNF